MLLLERLAAGVDVWQRLIGTGSALCQVSWSAPDGSLALALACIRSVWSPHPEHVDPSSLAQATEVAFAGALGCRGRCVQEVGRNGVGVVSGELECTRWIVGTCISMQTQRVEPPSGAR